MNEEHDEDNNDDYDREDLEHVENMLYANIHYNTGCGENQNSVTNQSDSLTETKQDSNEPNQSNKARRRSAKRYWSSGASNSNNTPNYKPFYMEKESGVYKPGKIVTKPQKKSPEKAKNDEQLIISAPKQFTPYVSFLPFNESAPNLEELLPPATTSTNTETSNVARTNNDLVRKTIEQTISPKPNPFSKKYAVDTYKQLLESNELNTCKTVENKKRLNPFAERSQKVKKQKIENTQVKSVRKNREALKKMAAQINETNKIDDDDDDVIILPAEVPELICVDSSDEETSTVNVEEHEFTEPNAVLDNRRKTTRCPSPSSSIQSTDDFIAQNDQRTFGFESFATLSDEDLCHVSETVENQLREKNTQSEIGKRAAIPCDTDNALFTPPKQMQKDKTKPSTKKSYEVAANSFTAVDVYESESSDMPDSIYAKGVTGKRKNISDSDSSSAENVTISKSKRFRKRKSSGSARESDQMHSDDSSSDLPEVDDTDDDDEPNENSYLVRGEALGKVKNSNNKKKTNKNPNEKRSEDEFINKLSSIVHGHDESDENDDPDCQHETSTESVEARDIVETVLQRRTKKSKKNQTAELNQTENDKSNNWAITDQVGETDELNLGRIFDADELNDDKNGSENEENVENKSTVAENESSKQVSNEDNEKVSELNQTITSDAAKEIDETNETTANKEDVNEENDDIFKTELGWNEEMRRFYNDSWGGETFSLNNIRARMPRGFLNWMIINKDKFPSPSKGRKLKCLNCLEFSDHLARNCPKPPSPKRCIMCGTEGHATFRCPNKICLVCGRKSQRFQQGCDECRRDRHMLCHICKQKGHRQMFCPDRWRRYHSTTTTKTPLIHEERPLKNQQKRKSCFVCGKNGHIGEKCSQANRLPYYQNASLSTRIISYRPILQTSETQQNNAAPKCTILTSDVGEFKFNFHNQVSCTGNTFYARFCRATNRNNESTSSDNEVEIVNDTSDAQMEIHDDSFEILDEYEDITSSEQTQDDSFVTLDSIEDDGENERKREIDNFADEIAIKNVEIEQLDEKIENLKGFKEDILSHKSLNSTRDNDDKSTTPVALPDFIPLTSDEPEKYGPARSPSPVPADSTTMSNEKSDATIHLTPQLANFLVSESGNAFLRRKELELNVSVRMEWRTFGNVLVVNGLSSSQQNFHDDLKTFFNKFENHMRKSQSNNNLPKNRDALIKFVRNQIAVLDSPTMNLKHVNDVKGIFHRIKQNNDKYPSKASQKKNVNLRKQLNMILFGRYGLGDGKMHLTALQDTLRALNTMSSSKNVSYELREKMQEHMDYIFSGNDHQNYENVIEHFSQLKRDNCLPALQLDRKLLGLKINVLQLDDEDTSSRRRNQSKSSYSPTSTPINTNDLHANRMYERPSSNDIQINVSTSTATTSSFYEDNSVWLQNGNSPRSNNRPLDKWNY